MKDEADRTAIDSAKKGSADLLILALVEEQALHGYDIARQIEERSGGTLRFTLASLYATLYRLKDRGPDCLLTTSARRDARRSGRRAPQGVTEVVYIEVARWAASCSITSRASSSAP